MISCLRSEPGPIRPGVGSGLRRQIGGYYRRERGIDRASLATSGQHNVRKKTRHGGVAAQQSPLILPASWERIDPGKSRGGADVMDALTKHTERTDDHHPSC